MSTMIDLSTHLKKDFIDFLNGKENAFYENLLDQSLGQSATEPDSTHNTKALPIDIITSSSSSISNQSSKKRKYNDLPLALDVITSSSSSIINQPPKKRKYCDLSLKEQITEASNKNVAIKDICREFHVPTRRVLYKHFIKKNPVKSPIICRLRTK